jgi:hypothetical protein
MRQGLYSNQGTQTGDGVDVRWQCDRPDDDGRVTAQPTVTTGSEVTAAEMKTTAFMFVIVEEPKRARNRLHSSPRLCSRQSACNPVTLPRLSPLMFFFVPRLPLAAYCMYIRLSLACIVWNGTWGCHPPPSVPPSPAVGHILAMVGSLPHATTVPWSCNQ